MFLPAGCMQNVRSANLPLFLVQGVRAVAVDALLSERSSIASSHTLIDEYTELADNVLGSLRAQRGVMKSAHKKVLDVATTLGISTTLMRVIERRTTGDKILVYGGALVVLMILGIVIWLTRS